MAGGMTTLQMAVSDYQERLLHRFWAKVDKGGPNGCWVWIGSLNQGGYGTFNIGGGRRKLAKGHMAHRFSWELHRGVIPPGMVIDHRVCRNKPCVNPDHLVVCTPTENGMQPDGGPAKQMARRKCRNGHYLEGDNLIYDRFGWRHCRTCFRASQKKHRIKRDDERLGTAPKICKECGQHFEAGIGHARKRNAVFCSEEHRQKFRSKNWRRFYRYVKKGAANVAVAN